MKRENPTPEGPVGIVIPIPADLREAIADVNEIAIRAKSLYRRVAPLLVRAWAMRRCR